MARVCITLACIAVSAALVNAAPAPNNRPIIGILTLPNDIPGYDQYRSYFPASYVKWLESAGARVVPIPFTLDPASLTDLLSNLNGALFTGGGADFTDANGNLTPFAATALAVFNESVTAWQNGETFPLWGTCLGHELISFLASNLNMSTVTSGFDSENLTLPLTFTGAAATSRMYGLLPANINSIFSSQAVTMNNHQSGVTPANFALAPSLANRFTILSTNQDRNGVTFVSSSEGQNGLPVYTTQYHPEKVQFEWYAQEGIDHSYDSLLANHYLSIFFVNQTRSNWRSFPTPAQEAAALIYNYPAWYTEAASPGFEQCYFFE